MEEQRRAAAAARQELKEEKKAKQTAAGPAPSMALRSQASLQRALSNDDDGMFWDYGQAAGSRPGLSSLSLLSSLQACLTLVSHKECIALVKVTMHCCCCGSVRSRFCARWVLPFCMSCVPCWGQS